MSSSHSHVSHPIDTADIIDLFDRCFEPWCTQLQGGAEEPYYRPATDASGIAYVYFREDYLRSALHEVAHWCHAGARRRRFPDYGYWYAPDGRDQRQQAAFFAVEARPQALEQLFCEALGLPFSASIDNLQINIPTTDLATFHQRIARARADYLSRGLPYRAARFRRALTTLVG